MSAMVFIVFYIFYLPSIFSQTIQDVGDTCTLESGNNGTCKLIDDCSLWDIQEDGSDITMCTGDKQLVCCPKRKSISHKKCLEYTTNKCKNDSSITIGRLIYNGVKVQSVEQFPYMALLGYGDPNKPTTWQWQCGGALISEQYILTAAHCLNGNDRYTPVVVAHLGFINKINRNETGTLQEFKIVERIKHPDRKLPKRYNDIALLKLDRPVTLTAAVYPACLHENVEIPASYVQTAGWGETEKKKSSDSLMKVKLKLISHKDCSPIYPKNVKLPDGLLDEQQFCAGDNNEDTCYGDSGGPGTIHMKNSCMHSIVGITSIGKDCGINPGIFTRVSHHVPWIESIVWPDV